MIKKYFKGITSLMLIMFFSLGFSACGGDDDEKEQEIPPVQGNGGGSSSPSAEIGRDNTKDDVVTGGWADLTFDSAIIYGYVNDGAQATLGMGIIYGAENDVAKLSINGTKVSAEYFDPGTKNRRFTVHLYGLSPNTTYYYYAFAGQKTANDILSFTTPTFDPYTVIDMGLSVKWGACNVGASSPEDNGSSFAWGETHPKKSYEINTYKWYNESTQTYTKYNNGITDSKTTLDLGDDAAYADRGDGWRMPTYQEFKELLDNTTAERVQQNDVWGYRLISKINGNSIFMPTTTMSFGYDGFVRRWDWYWSSTLYTSDVSLAWCIDIGFSYPSGSTSFIKDEISDCRLNRYCGVPIRPVYDD